MICEIIVKFSLNPFTNYFFVFLYLYGIGFFDSVPSFIILLHLHLVRVSVIFLC